MKTVEVPVWLAVVVALGAPLIRQPQSGMFDALSLVVVVAV
ncbi:hypothetical protein [Kibdelosporangium philippinense]